MDFHQIKFKGKNLNYITPAGVVSPYFYDDTESDWLKTWNAGFLTTCGFENIGRDCQDGDEKLGIHGRLANSPAQHVNISVELKESGPTVSITGEIVQGRMFGENLVLKRTIEMTYGKNTLSFKDEVYNAGYEERPMMLLYHFNMGYPLLSEKAKLEIPSRKVIGRTAHAEQHLQTWSEITPPQTNYEERCYYHDIIADSNGMASVGINNSEENIGLRIHYDTKMLDHFVQWKMLGKGFYAMGLEPCNATIDGRLDAKQNGTLKTILPQEIKTFEFQIDFLG
jgi:hypothetical protein